MKRRFFLLVLAAALCVCAAAFAVELTWNQTCFHKTSAATTLYVQIDGESGLTATSALPAGTYIRTTGQTIEGKTGISYSANNRDPLYGYIDGSVIVSATQTVTLPSGTTVTVGEALVRSRTALNLWLDMEYGETLDSATYTDENGEEHEIGNEEAGGAEGEFDGNAVWGSAMGQAYVHNGSYTPTWYTDENGAQIPVQICFMGLARSKVLLNGEEQMVETWRLSWETEAPEDQMIAVVSPSDAAEVRFLAKDTAKATVLTRVPTNRVVRVIRTGKNWTLVDLDDPEMPRGYISTPVLEFFPNIPMPYRAAKLSVLGRTRGSDPVWIRAEDSGNGRRIVQFDLGEPISVYAQSSLGWSEIDIGGYHAYILSEFVTFDDLTAEAP